MAKDTKNNDPKVDSKLDGVIPPVDQSALPEGEVKVEGGNSTEIKTVSEPRNVINTKKAAEVVAAGSNSYGNSANAKRGAASLSGGAGQIKDDLSATSKGVNPYRSGDRSGKRDDSETRKIDEMNAEIFVTEIKQSKPLYDDPNGPGWNGNYYNEHAISQRRNGGSPADPIFERSFDYIANDLLLYAQGQFNSPKSTDETLEIHSWNKELNSGAGGYDSVPISIKLGDFVARNLHVEIGYDGKIQVFRGDVDDITPHNLDELSYRMAGDARLRDINQVEVDRQLMIKNAGNESDPKWSCLGDTIIDSSDQNYLQKLIESIAGDYTFTSYRKACQAHSFLLNKTEKDGKRKMGPMAEFLNHNVPGIADTCHNENGASVISDCFYNQNILTHGGAGLYVAVSDSLPKYNTKGKLLNLPLSTKAPLSTAYKANSVLKMSTNLKTLLKKHELFSTIDGPYDPLKPIVCTDGVALVERINPFTGFNISRRDVATTPVSGTYAKDTIYPFVVDDFNKNTEYAVGDFTKYNDSYYVCNTSHEGNWNGQHFTKWTEGNGVPLYVVVKDDVAVLPNYNVKMNNISFDVYWTMDQFDPIVNDVIYYQHYENTRNKYTRAIRNSFAYGIYKWFERKSFRILDHFRSSRMNNRITDNQGITLDIPITSTMMGVSLWDLIVCESVNDVIDMRKLTLKELLDYDKNFGYPYTGLETYNIEEALQGDNFNHVDYLHKIEPQIANPTSAMRLKFPELFWPVAKFPAYSADHSAGVGAKVVLPSYFVQNQFRYNQTDDFKTAKLILTDDYATAAYPSERVGSILESLDSLYSESEEGWRLSLDRMVVYPAYEGNLTANEPDKIARYKEEDEYIKREALTYKYGMSTDGIPVIPYMAYMTSTSDKEKCLTVKDILSTPRELGLIQVAPAGYVTPSRNPGDTNTTNFVSIDSSYLQLSGPGFKMYVYHSEGNVQNTILNVDDINIDVDDSLWNVFDIIRSIPSDAATDIGCTTNAKAGFVSQAPFVYNSYNNEDYTYDNESGTYINNVEHQDDDMEISTSHKYLWTRLQRLPFVINPFDVNTADLSSADDFTLINDVDIFDFLIIFGFCGFRASDYKVQVNKRARDRINLGMNYLEDPFINNSSLNK